MPRTRTGPTPFDRYLTRRFVKRRHMVPCPTLNAAVITYWRHVRRGRSVYGRYHY